MHDTIISLFPTIKHVHHLMLLAYTVRNRLQSLLTSAPLEDYATVIKGKAYIPLRRKTFALGPRVGIEPQCEILHWEYQHVGI